MAISVPLLDAKGKWAGVIEGSLEVHRFSAQILQHSRSAEIGVTIVDRDGRVIAGDHFSKLRPLERVRTAALESILKEHAEPATHRLEWIDGSGTVARFHAHGRRFQHGFAVLAVRPVMGGLGERLPVYLLLGAVTGGILILSAARADRTRPKD